MEAQDLVAAPPRLVIWSGPNGSGKTTCYEHRKQTHPSAVPAALVNADVIALHYAQRLGYANVNELPAKLRSLVELKAGKQALRHRAALLAARTSFTLETTASSPRILNLIAQAQAQGYLVELNFVYLPTVELNLERIAQRVQQGGHSVPEAVVRRRYPKAMALMPQLLWAAQRSCLIDNSRNATVVWQQQDGHVTLSAHPELNWTGARLTELLARAQPKLALS